MSTEAASQFIKKIFDDEGVRNQLNSQVGDITHIDLSNNADAGNTFVKIAANNGFKFNLSELQQAYKNLLEQQTGYGELGAKELETVAGGRASSEPILCNNTVCGQTC